MKISLITVFPELHKTFLQTSLIARACEKKLIEVNLVRFSDMCAPKERIDEPTVSHGAGMIIKPEITQKAIEQCQEKWGNGFKIFFSPQGQKLTQPLLNKFSEKFNSQENTHLILVCSRYEGIDARVEEHYADLVLSIGDYVVMGGDLPAQIFLEGLLRLMPGIVGKKESVEKESFQGPVLDYPEYGLPVEWEEKKIPEILRTGNHKEISQWRTTQAYKKTFLSRFDWFVSSNPSTQECALMHTLIPSHYIAIMHTDVKLKVEGVGNTSIASLDIHDAARASITYGIKNLFIVSPLQDQQEILRTFLKFWGSEIGKKYNESRQQAVSCVRPVFSFQEMIETINKQENMKAPIIITTSAQNIKYGKQIDFYSQGEVWQHDRPVLFLFGTGQGLSEKILEKSDYSLLPISGLTEYNHLSVRSAISIVLDRWLGLHSKIY
jgi:tRNA (guanine37-N1)-methyltransferase